MDNVERVVFKLFAHPQLTVRELAGKAFSAFLNKSDYSYFIESFEKVVQHLGKYGSESSSSSFMDPYEAEGFMNAVLFLIKVIVIGTIRKSQSTVNIKHSNLVDYVNKSFKSSHAVPWRF